MSLLCGSLQQKSCTLETCKHANCDSFGKTGKCREHLKKKHSWLEVTLPGATHATLRCVHFLQSPSLQIAYFLEMKNKNPCCSQMDHDCRHNSLMKPACMHIYSTADPICQTGPETHNPTHYLPVNQLLCSLPCSIHVMFYQKQTFRGKQICPHYLKDFTWLYRAVWISSVSLWIPTHCSLK